MEVRAEYRTWTRLEVGAFKSLAEHGCWGKRRGEKEEEEERRMWRTMAVAASERSFRGAMWENQSD